MSKLPSNARRAFLRPANQRPLNGLTPSRIIGVALPVTIASTLFRHRTFTVSFNRTPKNLSVITVNSVPGHSAISTRRPPFSIISQLRCISSFTSLGVAGYSPSRPLQRCALPTRWPPLTTSCASHIPRLDFHTPSD